MARRATVQPTLRHAGLSLTAKRAAIPKLQRRLDELEGFDPDSVERLPDPRVITLRQAIQRTLTDIFGVDTVEYERYQEAAHLANEWYEGQSSIGQHRQYLSEDKTNAVAILQGIIAGFSRLLKNPLPRRDRIGFSASSDRSVGRQTNAGRGSTEGYAVQLRAA
jgi:hypothetical protein